MLTYGTSFSPKVLNMSNSNEQNKPPNQYKWRAADFEVFCYLFISIIKQALNISFIKFDLVTDWKQLFRSRLTQGTRKTRLAKKWAFDFLLDSDAQSGQSVMIFLAQAKFQHYPGYK